MELHVFKVSYPNVQEGIQWFYYRENYTFRIQPEGVQHFQAGGGGGGGVQILISIEPHITCDFPGGGGSGPPVPLWIHTKTQRQ